MDRHLRLAGLGLLLALAVGTHGARAESPAPTTRGKVSLVASHKSPKTATATYANKARGHHELLSVRPMMEKGRVVGAHITVALYPAAHDRVVLSLVRPGSKAAGGVVHRWKEVSGIKPGQEHTLDIRYGKSSPVATGEKLVLVSSWDSKGQQADYRDPFAMVALPSSARSSKAPAKSFSPASVASKIYAVRKK